MGGILTIDCLPNSADSFNEISRFSVFWRWNQLCAKVDIGSYLVRTYSKLHQHLYLSMPTPLRMQRGRYSFCGIHSTAIHEHAVVGRRLHHADHNGTRGLIRHRCSPSCPSDYASKPRRAHQSPSGTLGIPGKTLNQRACVLAYGGTTTFCSHRVCFSP